MNRKMCFLVAGISVHTFAAVAHAQDLENGPSNKKQSEYAVGEIVVTAQKRAESINDVGMSITALRSSDLVQRGVVDTADLVKVVPGFNYTPTPTINPVYTIRGIGFYETTLVASPAVAVYVDEIPLPYPSMTKGATLDLERVEVLKGPQGTLFGQNTTGGAVNYIAAKPTRDPQSGMSATYGRFNTFDLSGYVSGPISDSVAVRIAGRTTIGGNWQKSYTRADSLYPTDGKNGQQEKFEGRLTVDIHPGSSFRVSLTANGFSDRSDPQAAQLFKVTPQSPATAKPELVDYPLAPANARAADWRPGWLRQNSRFLQLAARAEYDVTSAIKLVSLTSYSRFKTDSAYDPDGMVLQSADFATNGKINSFNQELRLVGDTGRLSWMIGGNYEKDKASDYLVVDVADASTNPTISGVTPLFGQTQNFSNQKIRTWAAFANTELRLTDALKVQGAIRYTETKRDFAGCTTGDTGLSQTLEIFQSILNNAIFGRSSFVPIPAGSCFTLGPVGTSPETSFIPTLVTGQLNENNVSWRVGATYDITSHALIYANLSKGYKAGSFPTVSSSATIQYRPVKQESVLAYEVGFKLGLGGIAQLDAAAFYYDYKDKQILGYISDPIFGALGALITIPKSRVQGVEASLALRPIDGLTLNIGGTYIDAKIKRGTGYNSSAVLVDYAGNKFPYTPNVQVSLDGQYQWRLNGGNMEPFLGFGVVHNAKTNASLGEEADFRLPAYTLLDLRAGIENKERKWKLFLWGRNVTNKYYWLSAIRMQDANVRYAGRPATYGATFSKGF